MEGIKASHLESEVKDEVGATSQAVFWSDEVSGGTFQINQHPQEDGHRKNQGVRSTAQPWRLI